ncbi:MAG: class II fructose-bisphosphatase [Gaiellales bacterium]|jgi:fructose-1,6-bisphosphatase II|nr:class II fructose-bisphosphatase [Gaiellales bacterium]
MSETPDRNLALELVRVTEAAALAAARWVGGGDKNGADGAAVDAMRHMLATVEMDGVVIIGEGEKDEAPMLFNGEHIGTGQGVEVDIAVDPLEGTELCAKGQPNALAVVAASERGTMFDPGPCVYMEKLACGPDVPEELDIDAPIEETLETVARAKHVRPRDLMVVILDRPRHDEMVKRIRAVGTRIKFIPHGDVSGALMAASPDTGVDLLWGIGGTPEGVLSAAAFKCLGGQFQGKLWPRDDDERRAAVEAGYDLDRVLLLDDLVRGDNTFFAATGVTDGELLRGVRYGREGARTQSLVMRSRSGTVRTLQATHSMDKLAEVAGARYQ